MHVTAIVIAGAGARGAYEAGVIARLVPRLMEEPGWDDDRIVIVGTSAGAINTAALAAFGDPLEATAAAIDLWTSVEVSDIFAGLRRTTLRNASAYAGQVLGRGTRLRSLLDSSPLRRTMEERLNWVALRKNLESGDGWVDTAAIVTTACSTGRTMIFMQGKDAERPPSDERVGIDYVPADLDVPHVLASAAIPGAFRPIHIEEPADALGWYIDGGVRVNAPIRPALALQADRVVVVATTPDPTKPRAAPVTQEEPDVFDAAGVVSNAVMVDRMAEDVRSLRRTNALVSATAESGAGSRAVRSPNGAAYRVVPHIYLGPPSAGIIADMANQVFSDRYGGWKDQFSDLGVLGQLLGGSRHAHGDALSFLFFDRHYHAELVKLGMEHATHTLGPSGTPLPWRD